MADMMSYLSMGGYAQFVWPSYGITALVLIALAAVSYRGYRIRAAALKAIEGDPAAARRRRAATVATAEMHHDA